MITMPMTKIVSMKCPEHGAYEAISCKTPNGKETMTPCPICEQKQLEAERHERCREIDRREAEYKAFSIFNESSMPRMFSHITFDMFISQDVESDIIKKRMETYAAKFSLIKKHGSCATLIGNTGTGKTMLAAAVGNYIMTQGYTCFYTKCQRALSRIKRTWKSNVQETQEDEINRYRKPDLLIFDEVPKGCRDDRDWELIHDILDRRTEDKLPTITISTLDLEELKEKIGPEVFRRLDINGRILFFSWDTFKNEPLF